MTDVGTSPATRSEGARRVDVIEDSARARTALTEPRLGLLRMLRTPASASELAPRVGMSRQAVNYHLRRLEAAGLIELVEERARRGCTERVLRATAGCFIVDPGLVDDLTETAAEDRFASDHLIRAASTTVLEVARMQAAAERQDRRLLTYTIDTSIDVGSPSALEAFCEDLGAAIEQVVLRHHQPGGPSYRVVGAAHPAANDPDRGGDGG